MFFDLLEKKFEETKTFWELPKFFSIVQSRATINPMIKKKICCYPKFFEHCSKNSITKFMISNCHYQKWWPIFSIAHIRNQIFQVMTKFFGVIGFIVAFDYMIKKNRTTPQSYFGLPKFFVEETKKQFGCQLWWFKVVAIELSFDQQSCGNQIYFWLPCITWVAWMYGKFSLHQV